MEYFQYRGVSTNGSSVSGRVSALDRAAAVRSLKDREIRVFDIRTVDLSGTAKIRKGRPKADDYAQLIEQLGVLTAAGINILAAIDTLETTVPNGQVRRELKQVGIRLRQGDTLSEAMAAEMPTLPPYVPSLLRLAEQTGQFARVTQMIADQMSRADRLQREIRSALNYPLFLLAVGVLAVAFIFYFVVPRFAGMVQGNEDRVPAFSRMIFDSGLAFHDNFLPIIGVIGALVAALVLFGRTSAGQRAVAALLNGLPLVGHFRRLSEDGAWLRVLGLALESGARLLQALSLSTDASISRGRAHAYQELEQNIRSGTSLAEAVRLNLSLDPVATNLIHTGERAGELPRMLLSAADIYERRLETRSKQLTDLAEPVAVLLISMIVGGVVVSLVMAMTSLYDIAL